MTSALGTGFVESRHAVPAAAVTVTIANNPRPSIRTISRTRLGDITAHQGAGLAIARVRNADTEEVQAAPGGPVVAPRHGEGVLRSEEHTSELQSRLHLVCRLLLEKKKHN